VTANDFGLYLIITKPSFSYRKIAETAVQYNVRYLQLREKSLSDREILKTADEIMQITNGTETRFILNDRADLAAICGADGLHLGQDDIRLADAKKICGEKVSRFGLSTHNLEQVKEAVKLNPDYIGFGPIFHTPTKAKPDPVIGTEMIPEAVKLAGDIPVVAIGGIDGGNLSRVLDAGARNVCMVRYFMDNADFERRVKETVTILNDYGI
jgi:thiamine-phosphate pyrophosphorylase